MTVIIKTEAEQKAEHETSVQDAEAQAAAEMAAKAQESVEDNIDSTPSAEAEEKNEWDALLDEGDDVGTEDNPISEITTEVKEEVAEEPAKEEPAAAEEIPPAEEGETTEEAEVEIPEAEETPPETRTPEEIQTEVRKAREEAQTKLAEQFMLSEDAAEELLRNPNAVLPKLAANMFLDIYDALMNGVQSQMPGMVNHIINQQNAVQAANKAFYSAWPQLAKREYLPTINRIRQNYQQMNPGADAETAIKEIGAQAWVALKLPIDELLRHTQGGQQPAAIPQTQQPAVSRIPAQGGAAATQEAKPPVGEFEQLADEFLMEDAS